MSDIDPQLRAFHRMRAIATGLLVAMAVLFVLAGLAHRQWPTLPFGYVRAFAEAGMVGACADWFAVTALFRRPLGLPIPHTAIIPNNKDRIGASLGAFLADNFLTEAVLDQRLRQIEVARWGGEWIAEPGRAERLAGQIADLAPDMLDALPPRALRTLIGSAALTGARAAPAADIASKVLAFVWSGGRAQSVIERAAEILRDYLAANEEVILEKVQEQSYKWLPSFVDRMIARKLSAGVIQLLGDVCDPAHPWRVQLDAGVERLIERLIEDPELRGRAEEIKLRLLDDPQLRAGLDDVWTELERTLGAQVRENRPALTALIARGLVGGGAWLRENLVVQDVLNAWARGTVRNVIAPRRHDIGRFVAGVVSSWDTDFVVETLERQVGRDLQYIRINGTLVGGLVGLLIYTASRLFGLG